MPEYEFLMDLSNRILDLRDWIEEHRFVCIDKRVDLELQLLDRTLRMCSDHAAHMWSRFRKIEEFRKTTDKKGNNHE